MQGVTIKIKHL